MIPPARQRRAGRAGSPARRSTRLDCGHAGCVLQSERFVPAFLEAVDVTAARIRDRQRLMRSRIVENGVGSLTASSFLPVFLAAGLLGGPSSRPSSRSASWACGRWWRRRAGRRAPRGTAAARSSTSGIDSRQAIDADVDLAVVGHHRDVQAGAVEDRAERVEALDLGAHEVERHRRAGHVGDHQVVDHRVASRRSRSEAYAPHGEAEGARCGELGPVLERVGADRLVVLLGVACCPRRPCRASRSSGSSMSVPSLVKSVETLLAAARPLRLRRAPRPAPMASSELDGQLVAVVEVGAQRAAGTGEHDVVDGGAGDGVLDLLDLVEVHVRERDRRGGR